MKNTFALAMAAVALSFVAVPAHAQSAPGVQIILIDQYFDALDYPQIPLLYRDPSPQLRAQAQEEIRNTPAIRQLLQRRGIAPGRVNAVKTALNGGKVVYVD